MSEIERSLERHGLRELKAAYWNLGAPSLYEMSLERREGRRAAGGPLVVLTGQHTGRSPSDKFIVKDKESAPHVWWDSNKAITPEAFEVLHQDMVAYAKGKELYVQDLVGGADPAHRLPVRVVCHSLGVDDLFCILKSSEGSLVRQYEAGMAFAIYSQSSDSAFRCGADEL